VTATVTLLVTAKEQATMKQSELLVAATFLASVAVSASAQAAAPKCEINRPIVFAGLDWDSNTLHVDVARFILEKGYGCETDVMNGTSLPLLAGLSRGDVDVMMEVWVDNILNAWNDMLKKGTVAWLGVNFPDADQGWYVPRFLVEGPQAKAPDLKSVSDLLKYKKLFTDPEEPSMGRFYNGPIGWNCEIINTKKLHAYNLDSSFTNFRPGTSGALAASIAASFKRKKPIVAYYWGPTWVMGKYDLVKLEEPPYDKAVWDKLNETKAAKDVDQATAYPTVKVGIAANTKFIDTAPKTIEFLKKYGTSNAIVSKGLTYMQSNPKAKWGDVARHFLSTNPDLWIKWVPQDVAARVKAAL